MNLGGAAGVALGGLTLAAIGKLVLGKKSKRASSTRGGGDQPGPIDAGHTSPEQIRSRASKVADVLGQPGLPDYLAALAWTETGGTFYLAARNGSARGIFQLHAKTARLDDLGLPDSVLDQLDWSIALAAWLVARLRSSARSGQQIDWLAIRRGWAYPKLVADTGEDMPATAGAVPGKRSREVRQRFTHALEQTDRDPDFMYQAAFPPGYRWPGIEPVAAALGLSEVA